MWTELIKSMNERPEEGSREVCKVVPCGCFAASCWVCQPLTSSVMSKQGYSLQANARVGFIPFQDETNGRWWKHFLEIRYLDLFFSLGSREWGGKG